MSKPENRRGPRAPFPRALIAPVRDLSRLARPRSSAVSKPTAELFGVVDWALYRKGKRQEGITSLHEAYESAQKSKDEFVWLGLHQPSEDEFHDVAEEFGLHPLAVEDAIHAHQRPKIEFYGESMFAVVKTVRYVDSIEIIETGEIMLFLGKDFVISVRHGEASALRDVRHEMEASPDVLAIGPSAVLWAITDRAIDDYSEAIAGLAQDVEQIESDVFDTRVTSPTERIYKLKREVLEFRRSVDPLGEALERLIKADTLIDQRTLPYFRDVHDHALRGGGRLAGFDELLSDILQANVAQVTLRQNEDMRKITAWAAILAVITSIAGIYGMNFKNMPELHWADGYFICLGVMALSSMGLYVVFRRRRWL